jgi:hypothetical protein
MRKDITDAVHRRGTQTRYTDAVHRRGTQTRYADAVRRRGTQTRYNSSFADPSFALAVYNRGWSGRPGTTRNGKDSSGSHG